MFETTRCLHVTDALLGMLLFFPAKLIYLRGTWDVIGVYLYPGQTPKGEWAMIGIGLGGTIIIGYFLSPILVQAMQRFKHNTYFMFTRITLYIQAAINIAYMRGVWDLAEYYLGPYGWRCRLGVFAAAYLSLILLKASRSCITIPFFVLLDTRSTLLLPYTRFGIKVDWRSQKSIAIYALDSIFTQVFIITLVCLAWRSYLTLLQEVVFPQTPSFSAGLCMLLGVLSCSFLLCVEVPLSRLGKKIETLNRNLAKFLYGDILFLLVFLCQGICWGGAWRLDKMYVLPEPEMGGWVHHAVGTVLLIVLHIFNSAIAGIGCALDGTDLAVVIFQTKYLGIVKSYFEQKKQRTMVAGTEEALFHTSTAANSQINLFLDQDSSSASINPSSSS